VSVSADGICVAVSWGPRGFGRIPCWGDLTLRVVVVETLPTRGTEDRQADLDRARHWLSDNGPCPLNGVWGKSVVFYISGRGAGLA
jgi:hypothetical protein